MEQGSRTEAKLFYRKLDSLFRGMDLGKSQTDLLRSFLEESFRALKDFLRLDVGLLYEEKGDLFALEEVVGVRTENVAEVLDVSASPVENILRHGVFIFDSPDAPDSPQSKGVLPRSSCAGVLVGTRPRRHILFYLLRDGWNREELDFTLNAIRAALGARLMEDRLRGSLSEATAIQQSLLLEEPPKFPGYDIACRSIPAEEVGGDFYDFFPFGEILGLAIGDASGHGLPAALLVRDVVTGLRMGVERHLKLVHVFEKLNRVIHQSRLSSRFVSLFYGELEPSGYIICVNAGHQAPLIFNKNSVESLDSTGTVIGPLPEVTFGRYISHIDEGGVLLMCTDGILERQNSRGEFFGDVSLKDVIRRNQQESAQTILDRLFASAYDFGGGGPWEDDATGIILKRK